MFQLIHNTVLYLSITLPVFQLIHNTVLYLSITLPVFQLIHNAVLYLSITLPVFHPAIAQPFHVHQQLLLNVLSTQLYAYLGHQLPSKQANLNLYEISVCN